MGERAPALSAVVAIVSDTTRARYDTTHLERALEALGRQKDAPAMEIVVPYIAPLPGLERLRARWPDARFLEIADAKRYRAGGGREHHDELHARGVEASRGEIVAILEDHGCPAPGWAKAMMRAHRNPWAGVGGAIQNAVQRPLNRAVYYCDFGGYGKPAPGAPATTISDANSAYKRSALDAIRPVWREAFEEMAVNDALRARGERLAFAPDAIVFQCRTALTVWDAFRERFYWGRSFAVSRSKKIGAGLRLLYAALMPLIPAVYTAKAIVAALRCGDGLGRIISAIPLIALLSVGWAAGEGTGYMRGQAGDLPHAEAAYE